MSNHSIFAMLPPDDRPITHPPNRVIKYLEMLHWSISVFFFLFTLFLFMLVSKPSHNEYSQIGYILLLSFMFMMIFLPFHIGVRKGSNIYKPQDSYLTPKQLKEINSKLKNGGQVVISLQDEIPKVNTNGKQK